MTKDEKIKMMREALEKIAGTHGTREHARHEACQMANIARATLEDVNGGLLEPAPAPPPISVNFIGPNHCIISTPAGEYLQSYRSIVAFKPAGQDQKPVLDLETWDYSTTTGRYRNQFLGEKGKPDILKKIKAGEYELGTLNR